MAFTKVVHNKEGFFIDLLHEHVYDLKYNLLSEKQVQKRSFKNHKEFFVFLKKLNKEKKAQDLYYSMEDLVDLVKENLQTKEGKDLTNYVSKDVFKGINCSRIKKNDSSIMLKILDSVCSNNELQFKKRFVEASLYDHKQLKQKVKKSSFLKEPYATFDKKGLFIIPLLLFLVL